MYLRFEQLRVVDVSDTGFGFFVGIESLSIGGKYRNGQLLTQMSKKIVFLGKLF